MSARNRINKNYELVRNGVPECLHVDGGLEHKEYVSAIMRVEELAIGTKVFGAEGAAEPLSNDALHVSVAKSIGMRNVLKIRWYDPAGNCS